MDPSLPLPIARHFYKQYSAFNSNVTLIELPRTGHTAIGLYEYFCFYLFI
jgi:hypothetical protein